uniref:Uncharacterized protein n=1 Tax=Graphocephala atropunctata TaxID=36148 RepID=A0A1B6KTE1_9HEMI
MRHMSIDSYVSLNSIQRLVLLQLQDRPPPYSREYTHPIKLMNEITDAPPSYIEAVGNTNQAEGENNPVFVIGEHPITRTQIQDPVSSVENSLASDISSSPPQQSTPLWSATTSTEHSASQIHITPNRPLASSHHAVETYPSQNRPERCCGSNIVAIQNSELYM